jgi:hypothetical protein
MPADLSKIKDEPRIGFVAEYGSKKWRGPLLVRREKMSAAEAAKFYPTSLSARQPAGDHE